ncbi:unnamed protein product, partial [Symbiodinium microadriaticum]
ASFEREACREHRAHSCEQYDECFRSKSSLADVTLAAAKEAAATYAHEWEAVLRIECFIHAIRFPSHAEVERELQRCREKHIATDPVHILLPGPMPQAQPCHSSSLRPWQPGSPEFRSRWYSGLPGDTTAVDCASDCCMDTAFTPGYPEDVQHCPYARTTTTSTTTRAPLQVAPGMYFRIFGGGFRLPR